MERITSLAATTAPSDPILKIGGHRVKQRARRVEFRGAERVIVRRAKRN